MRKGCWLQKYLGEIKLVEELVDFLRGCCGGKRNKDSTIVGELVAIKFYHE